MTLFRIRGLITLCAALATLAVLLAPVSAGAADPGNVCKRGGWQEQRREDGTTFRNQGACVSYVATGGVLWSAPQVTTPRLALEFTFVVEGYFMYEFQGAGLMPGSTVTQMLVQPWNTSTISVAVQADGTIDPTAGFHGHPPCGSVLSFSASGTTAAGDPIHVSVEPPC